MMKFFLWFTLIVFTRVGLSQNELMTSAYTDYMAGRLDEALLKYTKLIQEGHYSSDLYYNLGCIYLKQNNNTQARLQFEKALRLDPSSSAIKKGIALSKANIEPDIEALPPFILYKWFVWVRNLWSSTSWGWLLLISILGLSFSGILKLNGNQRVTNKILYLGLLISILFSLFYFSRKMYEHKKECILILNQAMHVAPDPNSQVALPLGAGTKVLILDSLSAWYKVNLENNDEGWLPKVALVRI